VTTKDAIGNGMKGAAPDFTYVRLDERFNAAQHFARRFIGKGDQQDARRRDARFNQTRDAIGHGSRLAGACSRDNQQGACAGGDNGVLFFVEVSLVVDQITARHIALDDVAFCWIHNGNEL
jgi:hypothetical protein